MLDIVYEQVKRERKHSEVLGREIMKPRRMVGNGSAVNISHRRLFQLAAAVVTLDCIL